MNPFKVNTTSFNDYEVMKDLQAHCTRCELKSGQAKTWQTWRDAYGIQFAETSTGSGRYDIRKTARIVMQRRFTDNLQRSKETQTRAHEPEFQRNWQQESKFCSNTKKHFG